MPGIRLPLTRCMRLAGPLLIGVGVVLALVSPVQLPWRLACAALVAAIGWRSWRRYLRGRPRALRPRPGGGLVCQSFDGTPVEVAHCQLGVVRPWLVSARLYGMDGGRFDLFVPGPSLPEPEHWRLRRALLGFRPRRADAPADRLPGSAI